MITENKSIVEKVNKSFDDNNTEAFLACCADDMTWIMPGDKTYSGKESIRQMMNNITCEAPHFAVRNIVAENDMVMCNGSMVMKDKEGNDQDYVFCDVYHFKEQKIDELTSYIIKQKI